jgi:hypothetical protein
VRHKPQAASTSNALDANAGQDFVGHHIQFESPDVGCASNDELRGSTLSVQGLRCVRQRVA